MAESAVSSKIPQYERDSEFPHWATRFEAYAMNRKYETLLDWANEVAKARSQTSVKINPTLAIEHLDFPSYAAYSTSSGAAIKVQTDDPTDDDTATETGQVTSSSSIKPVGSAPVKPTGVPSERHFDTYNKMFFAALALASIDKTFLDLVIMHKNDGCAAWLALRAHYEAASEQRVELLYDQIHRLRMPANQAPREFIMELLNLVRSHNMWCDARSQIDDAQLKKILLRSLPAELYGAYRQACLTQRPPPTLAQVQLSLQSIFEDATHTTTSIASAVTVDKFKSGAAANGDDKQSQCAFCDRKGHTQEKCHLYIRARNDARSRSKITCNYCKKKGHKSDDCFARKKASANATTASNSHQQSHQSDDVPMNGNNVQGYSTASATSTSLSTSTSSSSDAFATKSSSSSSSRSTSSTTSIKPIQFLLDSAASQHFVNDRSFFIGKTMPTNMIVEAALGKVVRAKEYGTICVMATNVHGQRVPIKFDNVVFCPEMTRNLISTGQLGEEGYEQPDFNSLRFRHHSGEIIPFTRTDRVHPLLCSRPTLTESALAMCTSDRSTTSITGLENSPEFADATRVLTDFEQHCRFGHLGSYDKCDVCRATKSRAGHLHRRDPAKRADIPMLILYEDILGPRPMSIDGKRFGYLAVDEATGFLFGGALAAKSQCVEELERIVRDYGAPKIIRSDNEAVLNSQKRKMLCAKNGIRRETRATYRPAQMGMIERNIGVVNQVVRSMLDQAALGAEYWSFAFEHAIDVLNNWARADKSPTPTTKMGDLVKYAGGQIHVDAMIRTFGCKAHALIPPEQRTNKLTHTARLAIHLGISRTRKAIRFIDVDTNEIDERPLHDMFFHESVPGGVVLAQQRARRAASKSTPADRRRASPLAQFSEFATTSPESTDKEISKQQTAIESAVEGMSDKSTNVGEPSLRRSSRIANRLRDQSLAESQRQPHRSDDEVFLDAASQALDDTLDYDAERTLPLADDDGSDASTDENFDSFCDDAAAALSVHTVSPDEFEVVFAANKKRPATSNPDEEPISLKQALSGCNAVEWQKGIDEEMDAIDKFGTWTPCKLPPGRKAIPTKFVFKAKRDSNGEIVRWKARCVAMGNNMQHGIDYDLCYSATALAANVRAILAVAVQFPSVELTIYDVKNAYLNSSIDQEIYLRFPPGQRDRYPSDCDALRLNKGLYGIKQAGRLWQHTITEFLAEIGFTSTPFDPCIFRIDPDQSHKLPPELSKFTDAKSQFATIVLYVDDLVFLFEDNRLRDAVIALISSKFKIHKADTDELLGIKIKLFNDRIELSQASKIRDVLATAGIRDTKVVHTAAIPKWLDNEANQAPGKGVIAEKYRELVGKLHYIAEWTRPDIRFALMQIARFSAAPKQLHVDALERLIRYLGCTIDRKLVYRRNSAAKGSPTITVRGVEKSREAFLPGTKAHLSAFADSDFASDQETRRSTSGMCIYVCNNLVAWKAKMQSLVTLSSTAAEYVALASCCQEVEFLDAFLRAILPAKLISNDPPLVRSDNQSTIKWTHNEAINKRNKHVDVKFHFLKERVVSGKIKMDWVPSESNVADIMTKPLPKGLFQKHAASLLEH